MVTREAKQIGLQVSKVDLTPKPPGDMVRGVTNEGAEPEQPPVIFISSIRRRTERLIICLSLFSPRRFLTFCQADNYFTCPPWKGAAPHRFSISQIENNGANCGSESIEFFFKDF